MLGDTECVRGAFSFQRARGSTRVRAPLGAMTMSATLQFVANDIQLEGHEVDVRLTADWLDGQFAEAGLRGQRGANEGARVFGRLSRSDDDIVVRCRIVAAVDAECVRCLDPAHLIIDADLSLLLRLVQRGGGARAAGARSGATRSGLAKVAGSKGIASKGIASKGASAGSSKASLPRARGGESTEEYEFAANEAEVDSYDGETVVLDAFVREAILLEIPNFPLCSDACPGIRPGPAPRERLELPTPVDPRLAPLGAFKKQLGGATTLDDLVAAAAERSAAMGRPVLRTNAHPTNKKKK